MERVQRRLTVRGAALAGRAILAAGAVAVLAACNATDTKVRVGGGVTVTYGAVATSGLNVE